MKPVVRNSLLAVLAFVVVLPPAAYWLADRWLESAGGREKIEAELSRRTGMEVRLGGEFDLMLYPAIGVSGTGLSLGGEGPGSGFAHSREYEISVALKPLLDRRVLVEWVRLTGGEVYPDRYASTRGLSEESVGAASAAKENGARNSIAAKAAPTAAKENGARNAIAAKAAPAAAIKNGARNSIAAKAAPTAAPAAARPTLPEIREFTIRDLAVILDDDSDALQIKQLSIRDFAENRDALFSLEVDGLVALEGIFRWDSSRSMAYFGDLQAELDGQHLEGQGCLDTQEPVVLHLVLNAAEFDLDAFRQSYAGAGGMPGQGGAGGGLPIEIRAQFSVDKLDAGGVLAQGVVLSLGDEPACN